MESLFPDKIWNHKNFDMGVELEIAGEFIYDGMHTINQIKTVKQQAMIFSMLYHVSVGIERIQKIILILLEDISLDNYEKFEKNLITHSHMDLQSRIKKLKKFELISRENDFLSLLTIFYNTGRYNRFNLISSYENESSAVSSYVKKYISSENLQFGILDNEMLFSDDVKALFGKAIGSISKNYYELLKEICYEKHLYTYELNYDSKSAKIFYNTFYKRSLQEQKTGERIALGEFLIFLMNTNEKNPVLRHMKSIVPLEIDPAFIQQYIDELSKGIISQDMIDEVETQHENIDSHYELQDRRQSIEAFSNQCIHFEVGIIYKCIAVIDDFFSQKINYVLCCQKIIDCLTFVDIEDDEYTEQLFITCNAFRDSGYLDKEAFATSLKDIVNALKQIYKTTEV